MNKDNIMNKLMDIRELTGAADVPVSIEELNGDLIAIRDISTDSINELNSKPVMPKVFDNWRKNFTVSQESSYLAIESLNQEITSHTLGYTTLLGTWINNDFDNRYERCIEAILNGYEVSNDYGVETVKI